MSDYREPTLAEQRERLALTCQLDRLNLRLALRPTPVERLAMGVMEKLAPLAPHLPGRLGKWTRGLMRGTELFKTVYNAMSG
ncbi:MAG TPA: hypothetical protein VFE25_15180 [Opitutaceae bacterium]|jgi:hypothetical protein|nr:hypothetical protein [Opitutaceae bacterium]